MWKFAGFAFCSKSFIIRGKTQTLVIVEDKNRHLKIIQQLLKYAKQIPLGARSPDPDKGHVAFFWSRSAHGRNALSRVVRTRSCAAIESRYFRLKRRECGLCDPIYRVSRGSWTRCNADPSNSRKSIVRAFFRSEAMVGASPDLWYFLLGA